MTRPETRAMEEAVAEGSRQVDTLRIRGAAMESAPDRVAHEEPLEIQIGGHSIAVVMRTPGYDLELVAGFLRTEGILAAGEEPASLHHASQGDEGGNVVRVALQPTTLFDPESLRRNLFASSSCGICGRASRESALRTAAPLEDSARFDVGFFRGLPERLRPAQTVFHETGGLHAAALFRPDGELLVVREDVGRHNAVDKVIGWSERDGQRSLAGHALLVSGRVSFEIVQKALAARIPAIAAVSAPTSLAVDLASEGRILITAFLRGESFNAYGAVERLHA